MDSDDEYSVGKIIDENQSPGGSVSISHGI